MTAPQRIVSGQSRRKRMAFTALLTVVSLFAWAGVAFIGVFIGVMATDSCLSGANLPFWWLTYLWPAAALIAALTPCVFHARGASLGSVILSGAIAGAAALGIGVLWAPIIVYTCFG